jgi:hypothetical protein
MLLDSGAAEQPAQRRHLGHRFEASNAPAHVSVDPAGGHRFVQGRGEPALRAVDPTSTLCGRNSGASSLSQGRSRGRAAEHDDLRRGEAFLQRDRERAKPPG